MLRCSPFRSGLAWACLFAVAAAADAGERLPSGIELPDIWPPHTEHWTGEPMPVPYLQHPPAVISTDLGRQLFVDDFLIASTNLQRTFHAPQYHPRSPVLRPETPWENDDSGSGARAAPFSDGVWYDPARKQFAMWYLAAEHRTCLALSDDGLAWTRPMLDVEPGTNVVLTSQNKASQRDSNTVWLDHEAADPAERFKLFECRYARSPYCMALRTSPDGVHWSEEKAVSGRSWDRSTAFYNPFRKVWVASVRGHDRIKPAPHRLRCYFEGRTAAEAVAWKQPTDEVAQGNQLPHDLQPWIGADRLDPHHPDPRFAAVKPQLYNLDAFPYESLLVGLFTIWQGPTNEVCNELGIHKRNEVFVGFSRDGFHWDRANRQRFLPVSEDPRAWNAGNVQSVGGGCIVNGNQLFFYCSGSTMQPRPIRATGLATLRRDGFASMDAPAAGGTLTTRPLNFSGRYLFVNASPEGGTLRAELLDAHGKVAAGFEQDNCIPITGDSTSTRIAWKGQDNVNVGQRPLRIRFILSAGSLWSFWVTDDIDGTSNGYLAAGQPGSHGARDARPR